MEKPEFKHLIRLLNTDLQGKKSVVIALEKIQGVGYNFAIAICRVTGINQNKKAGELTDEEVKKLEDALKNPLKYNIPIWMLNRKKDPETGEDKHLLSIDLKLQKEFDIKKMGRIRSYKGIRHALGLPVRGQRTKAHFRHGRRVGVEKKAAKMGKSPAAPKKEEAKKGK